MHKGIYIVAADHCQDAVWKSIIEALSRCGSSWIVDCLDCLYDTALANGAYCADELLAALDGNRTIFSARMIEIAANQRLDRTITAPDDYLKSNSRSIVLCTDSVHFEVFSKCEEQLQNLMASVSKEQIVSADWIDDSFGGRTEFTV